jgi:hypothetical protein
MSTGQQGVGQRTLLLFSGGRDSTIAAIRIAQRGDPLVMVTVVSGHLYGLEKVRQRLTELKLHLPDGTLWLCVTQPKLRNQFGAQFSGTCLPCQRDYVAVGASLAFTHGISRLALGYTSYQSSWPEQHPIAVERLKARMKLAGLEVIFPTYDIKSKEAAQTELAHYGLSTESLEQKCLKQVTNIRLSDDALLEHLSHWEANLSISLERDEQRPLDIVDQCVFKVGE